MNQYCKNFASTAPDITPIEIHYRFNLFLITLHHESAIKTQNLSLGSGLMKLDFEKLFILVYLFKPSMYFHKLEN